MQVELLDSNSDSALQLSCLVKAAMQTAVRDRVQGNDFLIPLLSRTT
jgi:hypothetical protein